MCSCPEAFAFFQGGKVSSPIRAQSWMLSVMSFAIADAQHLTVEGRVILRATGRQDCPKSHAVGALTRNCLDPARRFTGRSDVVTLSCRRVAQQHDLNTNARRPWPFAPLPTIYLSDPWILGQRYTD